MSKERFKLTVDVHLILQKDRKILLLQRQNTGYEEGSYLLPAGHMDGVEPVTQAIIRESKEELGIDLTEEDLQLVHVMHNLSDSERIGFFFLAQQWHGEIANKEPEKCSAIEWFELEALPQPMVPYALHALKCYKQGQLLSTYGWS